MILVPIYDKLPTHIIHDQFTNKLGTFEIQSGPMVMQCDLLALKAIPGCLPTQPHVSSIGATLILNLIKQHIIGIHNTTYITADKITTGTRRF